MSLLTLDVTLRKNGDKFWYETTDNIKTFEPYSKNPAALAKSGFDIYVDPKSGATFGVPSSLTPTWDAARGVLVAKTPDGAVVMMVGESTHSSYADAKKLGKQAFIRNVVGLAQWTRGSPENLSWSNSDNSFEYANFSGFFNGTDAKTRKQGSLLLTIIVSKNQYLGYAVYTND